MYEIIMSPKVKKWLDKLSEKEFKRVDTAIWSLAHNPRPRRGKKLKGPIHRIRTGNWRIIYAVFDKEQLVIIGKVIRRSEDTYDRLDELF